MTNSMRESTAKTNGQPACGATVMMFVGVYGKASSRWLPAALRRLLDVPEVVLDLTEARISDDAVIDELLWLHDVRSARGLARERIVMTDEQGESMLSTLSERFDVIPDLGTAMSGCSGLSTLDYAVDPGEAAPGRRPVVITLEEPEWDIDSSEMLGARLAPAAIYPLVIVDLSAVSYMDSTCLGKLVGMRAKRVANGFSPAKLVISSPRVRRLFGIVHFDEIWPIFDSLDAALSD